MVPCSRCQHSWYETVAGVSGVKEFHENFTILCDRGDRDIPELSCISNIKLLPISNATFMFTK